MTLTRLNWLAAYSVAAIACSMSVANAQDANAPGIVRISDSKPRTMAQPASFHGHHRGGTVYAGHGDCPTGDCPHCDCQHGHCYGCPLFREHYCKKSPDYGYSPPAKYPLQRRGVQYHAYFPSQWYGTPGGNNYVGAPMVYQPTDTTQLGYYYQHVPFWQPNPSMFPQRPVPANWHIHAPAVHASSFHEGHWGGNWGSYYGNDPVGQSVIAPSTSPTTGPSPAPMNTPEIAPVPEASLPPAPREIQNQAESEHIRRAAF